MVALETARPPPFASSFRVEMASKPMYASAARGIAPNTNGQEKNSGW